jgi:hypothetical protein
MVCAGMADELLEPARRVPVVDEVDVLVLGGGPSGIAAATAAARHGATTLLVERYGFLGGMGTAAMVTNFCGLFAEVDGEADRIVRGIADEILERIAALDGLNRPQGSGAQTVQAYDTAAYKCAADQLVLSAGVRLRFHTLAVGAGVQDGRITSLLVESKSGRGAIRARRFVDCSGDADLAAWAGAPFEKGAHDGYLAYPTMMFRMGGVDNEVAETEGVPFLRELAQEAGARGELGFVRSSPVLRAQAHPGEWRANMTQVTLGGRPVDGTNDEHLTAAEVIGREQVVRAARLLHERVPGFEASYLQEIAPQIGIRETRRIVGQYVLTLGDVVGARDFPDAIGYNGWPVEKHVLGGIEWRSIGGRGFHGIPFRSLLPREVTNLLVAGRCLSATQDAQASVRVSGPCFAMGQAAGTAAALSLRVGVGPAALDVGALQAELRRDGAYLPAAEPVDKTAGTLPAP